MASRRRSAEEARETSRRDVRTEADHQERTQRYRVEDQVNAATQAFLRASPFTRNLYDFIMYEADGSVPMVIQWAMLDADIEIRIPEDAQLTRQWTILCVGAYAKAFKASVYSDARIIATSRQTHDNIQALVGRVQWYIDKYIQDLENELGPDLDG